MKKVIGVLFLTIILIATTVFAAYPEDLEKAELEKITGGSFNELTKTQIQDAEKLIEEPAEKEENVIQKAEESDLYLFDSEIVVNKNVNGNVYAMGERVKFENSVIYGNVFILAEEAEIKDTDINGSVYALGKNINFNGIAKDLYACGENISLGSEVNITRDIKIAGNSVKINGLIGRNAFIAVEDLLINDGTIITGVLNYLSPNEAKIPENAKILNVNFEKQETSNENVEVKFNPMTYVFQIVSLLFKTFIIALLIVLFIDKFGKIKRTDKDAIDLLKDAGVGALVLIVAPILSMILLFTGFATGMGLIAFLLYIVVLYASGSFTSVEIATRILNKMKKEEEIKNGMKIGTSVLVALCLYFVGLIPVVGGIVKIAVVLIGLGVLFNLVFKKV